MKRDGAGRDEFGCFFGGYSRLPDTGVPAYAGFLRRYYRNP
jgi:hypothetical protein